VWEFIDGTLIPALEDIRTWLEEDLPAAIATAKKWWEEELRPALESVWRFIDEDLIGTFEDIVEFFTVTIPAAIDDAVEKWNTFKEETLDPIVEVFNSIKDAIGDVIGKINDFISRIGQVSIPKALSPGSPSPFEISLRGIADAMQQVQISSGRMFGGVSPTASPGTQITNNVTNEGDRNEFNFTAQSLMQPGQMAMEFSTMAMRSR